MRAVQWACPYHPEHHVDGQHGGHASEREALQDAAAGVGAEASLSGAVVLPERVQEAQHIQLRGSAPSRERPARRQLGMRHQQRLIPGRTRNIFQQMSSSSVAVYSVILTSLTLINIDRIFEHSLAELSSSYKQFQEVVSENRRKTGGKHLCGWSKGLIDVRGQSSD